jgi:hypothetical protein
MRWKINLAKMLGIGRNGESTKEMMGRPLWNILERFLFGQDVASWELAAFANGPRV